jgi:non-ribosomal peptide synthetase component F
MEIFSCFFSGATLCPIIEKGDISFPGAFIERLNISIWISVPSSIGMMIKCGQLVKQAFPSIRLGFVCGEALTISTAQKWMSCLPQAPLVNLYGPTEATVACTSHITTVDDLSAGYPSIPIGCPATNTQILILKQDSHLLADSGETGRLFITGPQLSPGYWNNTILSSDKFISGINQTDNNTIAYDTGDLAKVLDDGHLIYVGRNDQQVQVMGFRVELSEIEAVFEQNSLCTEVCVVFIKEEQKLVLAYSINTGSDENEISKKLFHFGKKNLPQHMVPKSYQLFDHLPKNTNGKVDRNKILLALSP